MGPKGQNWTENRVFCKFLRNASFDFFDFLHDARHKQWVFCNVYGMLPKTLVSMETGSKGQNWTENRVFCKFLRNALFDFLIFCMMLDTNNGSSAIYMVCYRKLFFPWKQGQKVKIGPKIWFFANFSGTLHLIFLILCMMVDTNNGSSAMYMVCYRKLLFPWKQGQKVKFGPKIGFFANFFRTLR